MPDANESGIKLEQLDNNLGRDLAEINNPHVTLAEADAKIRLVDEIGDSGGNIVAMREGLAKFQSKISDAHGANGEAVQVFDSLAEVSDTGITIDVGEAIIGSITDDVVTSGKEYDAMKKNLEEHAKPEFAINTSQGETLQRAANMAAINGADSELTSGLVDETPASLAEELVADPYFVVGQQYDFIRNRPPGQADRGFIFEQKLTLEVKTSTLTKAKDSTNYSVLLVDTKNPKDLYDLVESHNSIRGYQISQLFKVNAKGGVKSPGSYSEKGLFKAAMLRTLSHARNQTDQHYKLRYMKSLRLTENMWLNIYPGEFLFPRVEAETVVPA